MEPKPKAGDENGGNGAGRWQEIKRVLDEALDLPQEARSGFLSRACGDDAALRREVESLLAEEDCLDDFLTSPLITLYRPDLPEDDPNLGREIGPYRLLRRLGRGGMGAVYLAERAEPFRQTVAVKLIKRGMDSEEILRRFRNERQILASLAHDQIARLYDGGTTGDGLPYFVMEYVEGEPIDLYCDRHRLPVERRLRLFHTVCLAVQEAHQKLVVHRDLKPGNILVTADGAPKLLDFGIAKLLAPDGGGDGGTAETVLHQLPLTFGYASPEQLRGEPVTTASDVYSLGVLLYQLLTGRRPYDAGTLRPQRWVQLLSEAEAPRPSTAVRRPHEIRTGVAGETEVLTPEAVAAARGGDPQRLSRKLAGDLDNVVMTAIARERARRYATAEQLAEDVRRYLEGLPVRARKPTLGYHAGKFVRRHAWGVAAAAAAAVLLLAFALSTWAQNRRIAEERDRAQAVTEYLVGAFESVDPEQAKGEEVTVREAMEKGMEDIDRQLREQPLIRATLKDAVGRVYDHLAFYEQARPLFEDALAEREEELGPDHPEVAESLQHLANLLRDLDETEEAEPLLRRAVDILRRQRRGEELRLAAALHNLGAYLADRGPEEEAESLLQEALAIKRRRLGRDDPTVATTLNSLATLYRRQEKLEEAERLFRRALTIRRAAYDSLHPEVARTVNNLAVVLEQQGKLDEARPLYEETLEIRRQLYPEEHPDLAVPLFNLGDLLQKLGELDQAEVRYREAAEVFAAVRGKEDERVGRVLRNLATLLAERGDHAGCAEQARQTLRIFELEESPAWRLADARSILGGCLAGLGRHDEAEPLLAGALGPLQEAGKADHLAEARGRLAAFYEARGRPEEAARYREEEAAPAQAGDSTPVSASGSGGA